MILVGAEADSALVTGGSERGRSCMLRSSWLAWSRMQALILITFSRRAPRCSNLAARRQCVPKEEQEG